MSLMLPFAVIPTITFTSNRKIMGDFSNGLVSRMFSIALSLLVIVVNTYFVLQYVIDLGITNGAFILFVVLLGVIYLIFCHYLSVVTVQGNYAIHEDELVLDGSEREVEDNHGNR